jgi:hypothetical protein
MTIVGTKGNRKHRHRKLYNAHCIFLSINGEGQLAKSLYVAKLKHYWNSLHFGSLDG